MKTRLLTSTGASRWARAFAVGMILAIPLGWSVVHAALVGHWNLNEGSGTAAADQSGNGLNGTLVGPPTWVPGAYGDAALDFVGSVAAHQDRVELPGSSLLNLTGAMTLTAWAAPDSFSPGAYNAGAIVSRSALHYEDKGWWLGVTNTGDWMVEIAINATEVVTLKAPMTQPFGTWTHVAGVYDPSGPVLRLYLNGVLAGELTEGVPAAQYTGPVTPVIGGRSGTAHLFDGRLDEVRVYNEALSQAQIQALPELVQTPIVLTTEPVSQVVEEARPVTFSVAFTGSLPHAIQWQANGIPIDGETGLTYTIPAVVPSMDGTAISVTVSNLSYAVVSSNATLTVYADTNKPTVLSVGSADGLLVGVNFSEPLDPWSSTSPGSYTVNAGAANVVGVTLLADGRKAALTLDAPVTGSFTVGVADVYDLSGKNAVAAGTSATGQADTFTVVDIGDPTDFGSTLNWTNAPVYEQTASGSGFYSSADQGHYACKAVTGDFDKVLRVEGLIRRNDNTSAGIMVRTNSEDLLTFNKYGPIVYNHIMANAAGPVASLRRRANAGSSPAVIGTSPALVYPDAWVRLRRTGDVFTGYYGTNGTDWAQVGQTTLQFTGPVLLGLAATAGDNTWMNSTVGNLSQYGDMVFVSPTLDFTQSPTNTSVPNNTAATFYAAATGTGAPAGEVIYQWQRDAGTGFVDIAGANGASYSFTATTADHNVSFRARAYLAGLVVDSAAAVLTVTLDQTAPTLAGVQASGVDTRVRVTFSEAVTSASATAIGNYSLSGGLNVSAATYNNSTRTATLTLDAPMTVGTTYTVTVNNVEDTAIPANVIAADSQLQVTYSSLVGHWKLDDGAGTKALDSSGNGLAATFTTGPTWVPGHIGPYAVDFPGNSLGIKNAYSTDYAISGSMTVCAWAKPRTISGGGRIVSKGAGSSNRGWEFQPTSGGWYEFALATTKTTHIYLEAAATDCDIVGKWTHVTCVYDASVPMMSIYTNGVLANTKTEDVPTSQYVNTSYGIGIGARPLNSYQVPFDGQIDDVRLYSSALSAAEIAALAVQPASLQFLPVIRDAAGNIVLSWTGSGTLEQAETLAGTWGDAPSQSNPQTNAPAGPAMFYRLRQ